MAKSISSQPMIGGYMINHDKLLKEIKKRLDYDRERGELRRKAGFSGVVAGQKLGSIDTNGRIQATFLGFRKQVSHLIWLIETGELPREAIHHIDGDKTNCRFENLKHVTRKDIGNALTSAVKARINRAVNHWNPPRQSKAISKDERLRRDRENRAENRDKYRAIIRKSLKKHHQKNKSSESYRASRACRQILNRTVQALNKTKDSNTSTLLGYTQDEFKNHLEKQFEGWMQWSNHGE